MDKIEKIKQAFNTFDGQNLDLLEQFYADNIIFQDPIHKTVGLEALVNYYRHVYKSVTSINFDFKNFIVENDNVTAIWTMSCQVKGFNSNKPIVVEGVSILKFNMSGKVEWHRDYFDVGEMIYEKIFGLGIVIRKIKSLLARK